MKRITYIFLFLLIAIGAVAQNEENQLTFDEQTESKTITIYDSIVAGLQSLHEDVRVEKTFEFTKLWNTILLEQQKDTLVLAVKAAIKKKLTWSGALSQLVTQIHEAAVVQKFPSEAIDSLLYADLQLIRQGEKEEIHSFLKKSTHLIKTGVIHKIGAYEVRIANPTNIFFKALLPQEESFEEETIEQEVEPQEETKEENSGWGETGEDDGWGDEEDPWGEESEKDPWADFGDNGTEEEKTDDWDSWEESTDPDPANIFEPEEEESIFAIEEIPLIEGMIAEVNDVDLVFASQYDTIVLKNTSGSFMYDRNIFVGKGGFFNWQQIEGLDTITTSFEEFSLDLNKPTIEIGQASTTYPKRLEEPALGLFEYRMKNSPKQNNNYTFPRFISYKSQYQILNPGKYLDLKGGIHIKGKKIYIECLENKNGELRFSHDNHQFKLESNIFELEEGFIRSKYAKSTVYHKRDSIFHKGLYAKYDKYKEELNLIKNKNTYMKYSPFSDSYHDIEIDVDQLFWSINDSAQHIIFKNFYASHVREASFKSKAFYSNEKYIQLKGINRFHPLQLITNFWYRNRKRPFSPETLADYANLKVRDIKSALPTLESQHLISYDRELGLIDVEKKGRLWLMSLKGLVDHDQFEITSLNASSFNAEMSTETGALKVYFVNKLSIADSLKIDITLSDSTVEIHENKNFDFAGKIETSMEKFSGSSFHFNYDSFFVQMDTVDYIAISLENKNEKNTTKKKEEDGDGVDRTLHKSSGTLYLNEPNNKSFTIFYPQYPYFHSQSGAYVFFDQKHILGGAYGKKVYFYIPPFAMDSLSHNGLKEVRFKGDFTTNNILPDMEEDLIVMEDKSLGIQNKIPSNGFPLYGDKGTLFGEFKMDRQGLRAKGNYTYLNVDAYSDDFVLFEDSVVTNGTLLTLQQGTHAEIEGEYAPFPAMSVSNYRLVMDKNKDQFTISNLKKDFSLFNGGASMSGTMTISKRGAFGQGVLKSKGTRAFSSNFIFKETSFESRNTKFEIPSTTPKTPALTCENVKLDFKLDDRVAYFSPEKAGEASNSFPLLKFKTSLYSGVWQMDDNTISFSSDHTDTTLSIFRSTRKDQDYLSIPAKKGIYYKDSLVLVIKQIEKIRVGGTEIYPKGDFVKVRENAEIDSLKNAIIKVDTTHLLYDASIKIHSRNRFDGTANYDYTIADGSRFVLPFSGFSKHEEKTDSSTHIMIKATTTVSEEDRFYVQPKMQFKGDVTFYSKKKKLAFDGYIKPSISGAIKIDEWIRYTSTGEDELVLIALDSLYNEEGKQLHSGLFLSHVDRDLYYNLLGPKQTPTDNSSFPTEGYLFRDESKKQVLVGPKNRIEKTSSKGNLMTYDERTNKLYFDGKFNLSFAKDSNNVTLEASGEEEFNIRYQRHKVNSMMKIFFNIPLLAYSKMAFIFSDLADELEKRGASEKITNRNKRAIQFFNDSTTVEDLDFTDLPPFMSNIALAKGIVFTDINMTWSPDNSAWYSQEKAILSNISRTEIDAEFTTYLEVINWTGGDVINLYMEAEGKTWFYFSYKEKENTLYVRSSKKDFNDLFFTKKVKEPKPGQLGLRLSSDMEKTNYVDNFRSTYLGLTIDSFEKEEE
ncbi:MAG: hypothetical protein AB8B61_08455 [Cyclobacteriaceae bacterium]